MKQHIKILDQLGQRHGYGHLMSLLCSLWRRSLVKKGLPVIGAFVPAALFDLKGRALDTAEKSNKIYDEIISNEFNTD